MAFKMDVLATLESLDAVVLDQHFVYKSGKHGPGYINMDMVFPHVSLTSELCSMLVKPFLPEVVTIAAPAVGGVALSVLTASAAIHDGYDVNAVWADKTSDGFAFERAGFTGYLRNARVLVVEDLLTTGGSAAAVCREAERHGAHVVGVSVICNRGGVTANDLDVPHLESLTTVDFAAVGPDECQLCHDNMPIVENIGHCAAYKIEHPDYPGGYITLL